MANNILRKLQSFIIIMSLSLSASSNYAEESIAGMSATLKLILSSQIDTHKTAPLELTINASITQAQPLSGIVLWDDNSDYNNTDAISLEYSYMLYSDIVQQEGVYNWAVMEAKLNAIAARKHQAIFRFRFVYPGKTTSVPDYIKALPDYEETKGTSEGKITWFPDWRHQKLQDFTLNFYTEFVKRYEGDPRLAYMQVGFGLWAEYHIYDGPFILGRTFPGKAFQSTFFNHLHQTFQSIPWSISIDAADSDYSPFQSSPESKALSFGLFDDSFMHENHSAYNTQSWQFFNHEQRSVLRPAGGEFSYYTAYDQLNVLKSDTGAYGESYESFAKRFHITYMIGNDQPVYQSMARIKEASIASGYLFKIISYTALTDTTVIKMQNKGTAPIYYNAYITLNGERATESLSNLDAGVTKEYVFNNRVTEPSVSIESDHLVSEQLIQFEGNQ